MKPNAIVFTSNTGYTEQYARLLGQKTGLPVYALDEARERLAPGNHILYLGWLMAGTVKGYTKAVKQYHVEAVCGVGMGAAGFRTCGKPTVSRNRCRCSRCRAALTCSAFMASTG